MMKTAASMRGRRRRSSVSPVPDSVGEMVLLLFGLSQTQLQTILQSYVLMTAVNINCWASDLYIGIFPPVRSCNGTFHASAGGLLAADSSCNA